jgi:antitoxin (DNA-binding transcriptional repressor) of toxin-antitoxin stability system
MKNHISATSAARNLSDLINKVRYRSEEFIIERGGEPVCRLSPLVAVCKGADLKKLMSTLSKPDPPFWDAVEEAVKHQPELPGAPWSS